MPLSRSFYLSQENIHIVPSVHYRMECAAEVRRAFWELNPDCVAVELPEAANKTFIDAARRLPDISAVKLDGIESNPLYYLSEPCDPCFEGLRSALEAGIGAYCIDLAISNYPELREPLPDLYAIKRIGLASYYKHYRTEARRLRHPLDEMRELHMAKRLKELSLRYDKVLFVTGMAHAEPIFNALKQNAFPKSSHVQVDSKLYALTEKSAREVMAECGWLTAQYNIARKTPPESAFDFPPDRRRITLHLLKKAAEKYKEQTGLPFLHYHLRSLLKFSRNYAWINGRLTPTLFQLLTAAKGCVDHNYAYEVWELATRYEELKNLDHCPKLDLTAEQLWGDSQLIHFHLREKSRKRSMLQERLKTSRPAYQFDQPGRFSICSYPPEDIKIERFGEFLKKKGTQILQEEGSRTVPFTASLEDGIDTRETIRRFATRQLFVKTRGRPPGNVGSVVLVFDEDIASELSTIEKYPWKASWHGEHAQESDMAFYASSLGGHIIGPGISRCEYGGFMMTYPPRRLYDIWSDPDYSTCRTKAETLLMAAIDYALEPIVVYVATKPPRSGLKTFASRFGKKIVYIPLGQLSRSTLSRLRSFHVLDGRNRRLIADEFID